MHLDLCHAVHDRPDLDVSVARAGTRRRIDVRPAAIRARQWPDGDRPAHPGCDEVALVVVFNIGGDHDPRGRPGSPTWSSTSTSPRPPAQEPSRTADALFRRYPSGCNAQTGDRYTVFATVFPKGMDEGIDRGRRPHGRPPRDGRRPRSRAAPAARRGREHVRPIPRPGGHEQRPGADPADARGWAKGGLPGHVRVITLDEVKERWEPPLQAAQCDPRPGRGRGPGPGAAPRR